VALGAYGRRQLTLHTEVELLFLHTGELTTAEVTQTVCYPLWEQAVHVEPFVRTVDECLTDTRRSWTTTTRFLDARPVAGEPGLSNELQARLQSMRRDREGLRRRIRADAEHRHTTHLAVTASSTPDLLSGRGGLLDIQALHWLDLPDDERTLEALDFLLATVDTAEAKTGHAIHRLPTHVLPSLAADFLPELFEHARWVAFRLDAALAPDRDDRLLGSGLAVRDNQLIALRPPPLERLPSLGLRVANLVGLAPPSRELMDWACKSGPEVNWEDSTLGQLWLLLRAADWRAWDFLDTSGLLIRFLPEVQAIHHKPGSPATGEFAVDTHSFLALRRLHEASEGEDLLVRRAWRAARQRDPVYLAVLLHELSPEGAATVARRLQLPRSTADALTTSISTYQTLLDTATRRDLHDEDLVLELASRIGSRRQLGMLFLVAIAHEMASGAPAWSPWKANLLRQLFGALEGALRQPAEVGARRSRSLEQRRERIVRSLYRRNLPDLVRLVARLPRRYVLTRTPALAARQLSMLERGPLSEGEVRVQTSRHRQTGVWDLLIVARDRPGLLAAVAGVLALRGASVLAADAATSSDGLVLDIFTVSSADVLQVAQIEADLRLALQGRTPLHDLLGSRPVPAEEAEAIHVAIDNSASQFFSVVEVRAVDQVGLLYRIASALHAQQLDIQHARIATRPDGALDVFYVRGPQGEKLGDSDAIRIAAALGERLRGEP
jgi:[protein-PII] uridylyltransferase